MLASDVRTILEVEGYRPELRAPRLPAALSAFSLTKAMHGVCYRDRLEDHEAFRRAVVAQCSPTMSVLDVGAGRGAPPAIVLKGTVARVVGIDVEGEVFANPNLDAAYQASVDEMPFLPDGSIDLAFARYVVEHVDHPLKALRELRRVLRPGGRFMFITPNRHHYMPLIAAKVGTRGHRLVNALRGRPAVDTFRTIYAMNSVDDVETLARDAGFSSVSVTLFESQPNYLTFHPALFAAGVIYERLVNALPALTQLRGSILGVLVA